MAVAKPQYWAIFKSDYIMNREGLISFDISRPTAVQKEVYNEYNRNDNDAWILPHNSYAADTPERHGFETFRQVMSSCARAIGYWPEDREIFDKSEVEYIFMEEKTEYRDYKIEGNSYVEQWVTKFDVREVAVYIGKGAYYA